MNDKLNVIILLLTTLNLTNIDWKRKLDSLRRKFRTLDDWTADEFQSYKVEREKNL